MKKSRFSETQIVSILRQANTGIPFKDLCRDHGIRSATDYKWNSKYGGMEASDLKRLKDLVAENARLKRMNTDLAAMKDLIEKSSRVAGETRGGRVSEQRP